MELAGTLLNNASPSAPTASPPTQGFAELGSEDFFKLLITQVTSQDPFEPTGNEELLKQIASIRDIELSTQLAGSLRSLTGQQTIGSASGLIGQHVTSIPGDDGGVQRGQVVGVRLSPSSTPVLILSSGAELPLDKVSTVEPTTRAAEALIGQVVRGLDRRDPKNVQDVEGVVTGVRPEGNELLLELDTGEALRLRDVYAVLG